MATAKCASIGHKQPAEDSLYGISEAYASKFNRPAMRTASREHRLNYTSIHPLHVNFPGQPPLGIGIPE